MDKATSSSRLTQVPIRVTGTSPDYGNGRYICRAARSVTVVAAKTVHVNVFCQER